VPSGTVTSHIQGGSPACDGSLDDHVVFLGDEADLEKFARIGQPVEPAEQSAVDLAFAKERDKQADTGQARQFGCVSPIGEAARILPEPRQFGRRRGCRQPPRQKRYQAGPDGQKREGRDGAPDRDGQRRQLARTQPPGAAAFPAGDGGDGSGWDQPKGE
jgi:hypothetical protein